MEKLTVITKELLLSKIEELTTKIQDLQKLCLIESYADFKEFAYIEIESIELQIDFFKQTLIKS